MDRIEGHNSGECGCLDAASVDRNRDLPPPGRIPVPSVPTLNAVDFTAAALQLHVQTRWVPLIVRDAFDPVLNQVRAENVFFFLKPL
jgi:hypothetical protein